LDHLEDLVPLVEPALRENPAKKDQEELMPSDIKETQACQGLQVQKVHQVLQALADGLESEVLLVTTHPPQVFGRKS